MYGDIIVDGSIDNNAKVFRKQCHCMHGCTEIFYQFDIDRAKLLNISITDKTGKYGIFIRFQMTIKMNSILPKYQNILIPSVCHPFRFEYSLLVVDFGTAYFEKMIRTSVYTITDLLSMVGIFILYWSPNP